MIFSAHNGSLHSFYPHHSRDKNGKCFHYTACDGAIFANVAPQPHFQPHLGKMRHDRTRPVTNSVMLRHLKITLAFPTYYCVALPLLSGPEIFHFTRSQSRKTALSF